jgi:hypothetical protein
MFHPIAFQVFSISSKVGRPLFWSAGPLFAAQWTSEMIADQQTGKNSGPLKLSFRYSAVLSFGLFKKLFQREEIIK